MRIFNRVHVPWAIFVAVATLFCCWIYLGNFQRENLPHNLQLPSSLLQKPSDHRSVGGTPIGLIFGITAFAIFVFAGLLGVRKKIPLWSVGSVQRWMRAHIWLTLLTIPLVILHSGLRMGGPMTVLLIILYVIVMVSGIYGLVLQHQMPRIMMERLPAEAVYEQIPYIRAQLYAVAHKMRESFRHDAPTKTDAGPSGSATAKALTAGSTARSSNLAASSIPSVRVKTVAEFSSTHGGLTSAEHSGAVPRPVAATSVNYPRASTPAPSARAPVPAAAVPTDAISEATLVDFLDRQVLPYLAARNGKRLRLGNPRFSEDTFRFLQLRVTEVYRGRVAEMQAWCDERRMLDLQIRLQRWLHGWLFVHVPISFVLLILTAWHAVVTLFYY
ncbi:MAG: hypothetical protein JWO45_1505 [Spartobacteria bacterium]|nr:hypothetical protein [Spartobacteria bacterium]